MRPQRIFKFRLHSLTAAGLNWPFQMLVATGRAPVLLGSSDLVVDDGGQWHGVETVIDGLPDLGAGHLAELGDTLPADRIRQTLQRRG